MIILKLNNSTPFFWSSKVELDENKLLFKIDDIKLKATKKSKFLYKSENFTPTKTGSFILKVIYDDKELKSIPFKVKEFSFEDLIDFNAGNWEIKDNKMYFYDLKGEVLAEFNLFDKANNPTEVAVTKRVKR